MSAPLHERVDISLGERSYPILIGPRLLEDAQLLNQHIAARNLLIVTNETIAPLYLAKLQNALQGRRTATLVVPAGAWTGAGSRPVVVNNLPIDALGRTCTPGWCMSRRK